MLALVEAFLLFFASFIAWPMVLLSVEIIGAIFSKSKKPNQSEAHPSVTILIPAHDEELGIVETIGSLVSQLGTGQRVLVVADNCSDETAKLAKRAGAEVIIRSDANNRGKGFALDFGIQHLKSNPPDIVIIVDADCSLSLGSITILAQAAIDSGRPAQALNLSRPNDASNVGQQISAFAMIFKNHIRLLGLKKFGAPCHLLGTGMAFPWRIIAEAELANDNIVEDMKLGIDLVKSGSGALYCPSARVDSQFPESISGQQEQKTRWVHGHLQTILTFAPNLIWDCLRRRRWRQLVFALDLAVPPLSLVLFLMIIGLFFTGGTTALGAGLPAFTLLLGICILFSTSLFLAWWRFGRDALPPKSLIGIPGYILSKIALYRRFIRHRQKDWIRTERR